MNVLNSYFGIAKIEQVTLTMLRDRPLSPLYCGVKTFFGIHLFICLRFCAIELNCLRIFQVSTRLYLAGH